MSRNRPWTQLLQAAGGSVFSHQHFGSSLTARKLIAQMTVTACVTGKVYFADGSEIQIGSKEWLDLVRWMFTHIDGPAPQAVEMSTPKGESIKVEDVTQLTTEERLARITALYDAARTRAAGHTTSGTNGTSHTNGVHKTGLADT